METASARPRPTKVRDAGRILLLLGAVTAAVGLFAPWQSARSVTLAHYCQCGSTASHAQSAVIAWFLAISVGAAVLAIATGSRSLPWLAYGTLLVPLGLVTSYAFTYLSTGADDYSMMDQVDLRWGVVALGAGVILLAAGFLFVALTSDHDGELEPLVRQVSATYPTSPR